MQSMLSSVLIAVIATAGLCFGLVATFGGGSSSQSVFLSDETARTISVNGTAERFVQPDTATLSFTINQKSPTIALATNSVNRRIADLLGFLRSFGINDEDMKTLSYRVNPEYVYEGESSVRRQDGYRVNQSVQIKIRDLDNVEAVLTRIGEIEIDNLNGPQFSVDDDKLIRVELRKEAIADAKEEAKALGKDLGVNLRTIVGFQEFGVPVAYNYANARNIGLAGSSDNVAEIPAGEDLLSANVSIVFEIE